MSNLRLTFACGPYDRTQAVRDGTIQPEAVERLQAMGRWMEVNGASIRRTRSERSAGARGSV